MSGEGRRRPGRPRKHRARGEGIFEALAGAFNTVKKAHSAAKAISEATGIKPSALLKDIKHPTGKLAQTALSLAGLGKRKRRVRAAGEGARRLRVVGACGGRKRRVGGALLGSTPGYALSGQGRRRRRRVGGEGWLEDFGEGFRKGFLAPLHLAREGVSIVGDIVKPFIGTGRRRHRARGDGYPLSFSADANPNSSNSHVLTLPAPASITGMGRRHRRVHHMGRGVLDDINTATNPNTSMGTSLIL